METNYENAPSTALLATNCLACNRPLRDAASVEAGIGPICREKYGYDSIAEDVRIKANALIHEAARKGTPNARVLEIADLLEDMGASVLADKVRTRFTKTKKATGKVVRIEKDEFFFGGWASRRASLALVSEREKYGMVEPDSLFVYTPYIKGVSKAFGEDLKRTIEKTYRGIHQVTKDDGTTKFGCWVVSKPYRRDLWELLKTHFAGLTLDVEGVETIIPAN